MIPKVIYYAWFGEKKKPDSVKHNIRSWKKFNPSYRIVEINETNFNLTKFHFVEQAYYAKKWAFVSDVARIAVIYQNGGIYLDTDVEAIKSFDFLLKNFAFWGLENSDAVNTGLMFGAEKGYRTLNQILERYASLNFVDNEHISEVMTVPIVSKILMKHGFRVGNHLQRLDDKSIIYPTSFFAPYHFWGGGRLSKQTVSIHHYSGSWLDDKKGLKSLSLKNLKRWGIYFFPRFVQFTDRMRGK